MEFWCSVRRYITPRPPPTAAPRTTARRARCDSTYLVISILLIYLYQRSTRHSERFATVTGKGYRPKLMDLGVWRYVALSFFVLYFCLAVLFPILIMFWASLIPFYQAPSFAALSVASFVSYTDLLNDPEVAKAVHNTAWLMLESAAVTTVLATAIAWAVLRSKFPGRRMLDVLTFPAPRSAQRCLGAGSDLRLPDL